MARRVVWSAIAGDDLEAAADFIARDSPQYGRAFVREMRDAARSLSHFAEGGRVAPEFKEPVLRELLVRNYRLIYRVSEMTVYRVRLVHGARDLRKVWDRQGEQ